MTGLETQASNSEGQVDRWGAFASTACAVHCAMCAFIPASFAALGLDFLLGHEAEWGLTLFAVCLGLVALFLGWRRHGNMVILVTLSVGIIGLLAARGLESGGHHDSHGEAAEHAEEKEQDHSAAGASSSESGHEEHGHFPGESLGILAGLILMAGHTSNLRQMKRGEEDAAECAQAECCS